MREELIIHTQKLIKESGLRKTIIREEVLAHFLESGSALAHSEIEDHFNGQFDRVTLYRTMKSFEEKGLIHKVIDDGAVVKYASCADGCTTHAHHDEHVHFKCGQCLQTVCLHEAHIHKPALPKGFVPVEYQLLITGTCPTCAAK